MLLLLLSQCKTITVLFINLYQYIKVFQCDTSTFIYTNKFNQYSRLFNIFEHLEDVVNYICLSMHFYLTFKSLSLISILSLFLLTHWTNSAEIHQGLQSQFYLIVEFFIGASKGGSIGSMLASSPRYLSPNPAQGQISVNKYS